MRDVSVGGTKADGSAARAHGECTCIPESELSGDGRAPVTACACAGVEKVVHREERRSRLDVAKVLGFAVLLAALVLAIALWW